MSEYDALIIGAGTAGESVVWPLNEAGMKVAVIERELVGGLCAYWGCIPSKTLLRPGTIAWEARHGVGTAPPDLDWPQVARYRDEMVRDWNDTKQVDELQQAGIDFFRGTACLTGHGEVQVDGQTLRTRRLVIATGTEAAIPPIDGLKDIGYWTNREGTELHTIPESVLVLGGGAVGCELAQMLHSFGSKVTLVEAAPQLLGTTNPRAAAHLQKRFEGIGIGVHVGRKAVKFEERDGRKTATLDDGSTLSADVVLVATGRAPRVKGLGLETIGIQPSRKGIEVDEYCRAGENVWAVGDITGVAGFTHVADYQGQIAVADILGRPRMADYSAIPAVTYVDPEVASVGIADESTAPQGMEIVTAEVDLNAASRTPTYGKDYMGGMCLLADRRNKVLVGAWAVGPLAGEWIQFATLAIRARVPIRELDDTILAFPTFTRLYLQPIRDLKKKVS